MSIVREASNHALGRVSRFGAASRGGARIALLLIKMRSYWERAEALEAADLA